MNETDTLPMRNVKFSLSSFYCSEISFDFIGLINLRYGMHCLEESIFQVFESPFRGMYFLSLQGFPVYWYIFRYLQ